MVLGLQSANHHGHPFSFGYSVAVDSLPNVPGYGGGELAMRQISLTKGRVARVDDDDFDELAQHRWYAMSGYRTYYAARKQRLDGRVATLLMHRVLVQAPDGLRVDHWDDDGLNNQRANLRLATGSQNSANMVRLAMGPSGRRGVSWSQGKHCWQAGIKKDGRQLYLGSFSELNQAARAYDAAALALYGAFARPNYGDSVACLPKLLTNPPHLLTNNTSGYRGVTWNRAGRHWAVSIQKDGRRVHLGKFTDPIEAACAYDAAAREIHGDLARLNFPEAAS